MMMYHLLNAPSAQKCRGIVIRKAADLRQYRSKQTVGLGTRNLKKTHRYNWNKKLCDRVSDTEDKRNKGTHICDFPMKLLLHIQVQCRGPSLTAAGQAQSCCNSSLSKWQPMRCGSLKLRLIGALQRKKNSQYTTWI